MTKVFKVLGSPPNDPNWYRLCYTDDKKACLEYYVERGWKPWQIKFEEIET